MDPDFIERRTVVVSLQDGTRVLIRPVVPGDKERFVDGFARLSPRSRYRRFMSPLDELSPEVLRYFTEVDYVDPFAYVALLADDPDRKGMGVARYVRLPEEPRVAEAAVTVVDEYQGRGLGTLLLDALGAVALENGIDRFRGYALEENRPILDLLAGAGADVALDSPGVYRLEVDLPRQARELKGSPLYRVFRALARGQRVPIRFRELWSRPG